MHRDVTIPVALIGAGISLSLGAPVLAGIIAALLVIHVVLTIYLRNNA